MLDALSYESFLGAVETLRRYKPFLVVEILHGGYKDNIIPFLKGLGYKWRQIDKTNYYFE